MGSALGCGGTLRRFSKGYCLQASRTYFYAAGPQEKAFDLRICAETHLASHPKQSRQLI